MKQVALALALLLIAAAASAQECGTLVGADSDCNPFKRIDADGALLAGAELELPRVAIVDISTPNSPAPLGHYLASGSIQDVAISGSTVLAIVGLGIDVISIADPRNPVRVGRLTTTGFFGAVTIDGTTAAALNTEFKRFDIIDLTNPAAPALVASVADTSNTVDIALSGDLLIGIGGAIERIDVSTPSTPVRLPVGSPIPEVSYLGIAATERMVVLEKHSILQGDEFTLSLSRIANNELGTGGEYNSGDVDDVAVAGCRVFYIKSGVLRTVDVSSCITDCATCIPSETNVCLAGGRFSVSATWRTSGSTGVAHRVNVSDDTAGFWFFGPQNTELLFKVLNGCTVNNHYWFYAGGLTDQEVTITVKDTKTNATKTYTNPLGRPFQIITDSSAFPCP